METRQLNALIFFTVLGLLVSSGSARAANFFDILTQGQSSDDSDSQESPMNAFFGGSQNGSSNSAYLRDKRSMERSRMTLQEMYAQLRRDQQAGLDTTADLEAIERQKQSYADDAARFQAHYQNGAGSETFQRDQRSVMNSRMALDDMYAKLRQDQQAGLDTTADLEAIERQKQSYADDLARYQQSGGTSLPGDPYARGGYRSGYQQQGYSRRGNGYRRFNNGWEDENSQGNSGWNQERRYRFN